MYIHGIKTNKLDAQQEHNIYVYEEYSTHPPPKTTISQSEKEEDGGRITTINKK